MTVKEGFTGRTRRFGVGPWTGSWRVFGDIWAPFRRPFEGRMIRDLRRFEIMLQFSSRIL